ncbi:hypothetical protein COR50_14030 [Chitinophaga caeni]|uniref:Uncharacterized protein n=1 Tax=Chitinophaga caeni TaxID=2029983 RepID=A0A291QW84_9BACT|nr:hypothetical protein [Chitinophaga caeni]ATL48190.1 hypothetical protein COR50_14030 [Chitinophaga caeni]
MKDKQYFKKGTELDEGWVVFYFEFEADYIIRQIEVYPTATFFLDEANPEIEGHMLGDQSIRYFDYDPSDIISAEEFFQIWNTRK